MALSLERSIPVGAGPREPRAGDCVGRYELLHPIARGGMGYVWAARLRESQDAERIVAIKTALPELACDRRVRAMFLDEARVASAIDHPNVAPVLEFIEDSGAQYLVMEWVEGPSLQMLHELCADRRERIPVGILLRVMADVCAGLHAAHELRDATGGLCGLVHRDVSPQNILISVDGVSKLIDFGVAKARNRATQETTFGALKGKLAFMSPEQARGEEVDRRADIWSVGATLFYLVTGQGPFAAEDRSETLRMLITSSKPRPVPRGVHPAVLRLLGACLARRQQDRFATARQLQLAIEDAIEEIGEETTAKDVAAFIEERAGEMVASQRAQVRARVREPQGSLVTQSGVVVSRPLRARSGWLALIGAAAVAAATALTLTMQREPARAAAAAAPPAVAAQAPAVPSAPEEASASPAIIEIAPTFADARPANAHRRPPVTHPQRAATKVRAARPPSHATASRTTDDFGSAVETRK
jgi:serine/threonine-protein kinase